MRKLLRLIITRLIINIRESNYNCSFCDYYKPRKPNKLESED